MDRRTFLKKYTLCMSALPAGLLIGYPAIASYIDLEGRHLNKLNMKKIIIIDGGPRRNMNTAQMLRKVAEGALSLEDKVEVKTIRLYDLDYKGCMSCSGARLSDLLRRRDRADAYLSGASRFPLVVLQ